MSPAGTEIARLTRMYLSNLETTIDVQKFVRFKRHSFLVPAKFYGGKKECECGERRFSQTRRGKYGAKNTFVFVQGLSLSRRRIR